MTDEDGPPANREDGVSNPDEPGVQSDATDQATPTDTAAHPGDSTADQTATADTPAEAGDELDREALQTDPRTLDAGIRWKWWLRWTIVAAVLGAIAGVGSVYGLEWGVLPGLGVFVLALGLGIGHAVLLYRSWEYQVREDALYLERGVITHVKTVAPFVRVQHIDTSRDPVDRLLGLSSLVVYTAGSRGADVTVPGLSGEEASDLQDRLKELAKDASGDDAV